jgi:hypothetical protein
MAATTRIPGGSGQIAGQLRDIRETLRRTNQVRSPGVLTKQTTMGTTRKAAAQVAPSKGGGDAVWL